MRTIKIILLAVLVLITALFGATEIQTRLSHKDEGPTISSAQEILEISVKDDESVLMQGLTASDKQDGDLTDQILMAGISKLVSADKAKVTYLVFDSDDNMGTLVRYVRYTDYQKPVFTVEEPLTYRSSDTAALLQNLHAQDVIDGDLSDQIRISSLWSTEYSGVYSITAQVTNSMGDTARVKLPVQIQEEITGAPQIRLSEHLIYVNQGDAFDPEDYLLSASYRDNQIERSEIRIESQVDTAEAGDYWVFYSYTDGAAQGMAILTVVVQ